MCFFRNGGTLCSNSRLGCRLGKRFLGLTVGQRNCCPGRECPAPPPPIYLNLPKLHEISDKPQSILRCSTFATPEKPTHLARRLSGKEQWYDKNSNIIFALARAMGVHGDVVFEFLYALTLQNFEKVLNPVGHCWNHYRVPLSNFDTCDYYMGIFDSKGNLRDPYHPASLLKLLSVMQSLLNEESGEFSEVQGNTIKTIRGLGEYGPQRQVKTALDRNRRIANRAGIGPDSVAWANGRRRRFQSGETYRLGGFKHGLVPSNEENIWKYYNNNFAIIFGPMAGKSGIAGKSKSKLHSKWKSRTQSKLYGKKSLTDRKTKEQLDKLLFGDNRKFLINGDGLEKKLRRSALLDLIDTVNQRSSLHPNSDDIVNGIKKMDLKTAKNDEIKRFKRVSNLISSDYAKTVGQQLKEKIAADSGAYGKILDPPKHTTMEHKKKHIPTTTPPAQNKPNNTYYYGAQVPVLIHEPFNRNIPRTWIRRHPQSERMNELNEIVNSSGIKRYTRQSVRQMLEKARQRVSIRSAYNAQDDAPRQSKAIPTKRKFKSKGKNAHRSFVK